jgi:hypothetical protein
LLSRKAALKSAAFLLRVDLGALGAAERLQRFHDLL